MTPEQNEAFLDDLALLVDGDAAALARWADLLVDDDQARDVLHEARRAARLAKDAGAGFEVPADLEARVLAQIDGVSTAATLPLGMVAPELPSTGAEPSSAEPSGAERSSASREVSVASAVSAADARWAPGLAPLPPTRVDDAPGARSASTRESSRASSGATRASGAAAQPRSRAGFYAAAAVALLSAAAGGLVWTMRRLPGAGEVAGPGGAPVAATVRVDALAGEGLVLVAAAGERPLGAGESVEGARLRTDARTRARLVLGDGSVVTTASRPYSH